MPVSIRARTTAVATAVVGAALVAAIVLVTALVRANLTASAQNQAKLALDTVAERLLAGQSPDLVSDGTTSVWITGPGLPPPSLAAPAERSVAFLRTVVTGSGTYTVMSQTSLAATDDALSTLAWSWGGIALLVLIAAAATTRLAVGSALAPIERIRAEFADITTHDLHRRVPLPRTCDEVDRLAVTMNTTLDRLEHAVNRHRQFVADASHELRGPIAALRTELELAVDHPERTDWPASARDALGDTRRLAQLTDDLLLLARMDAGEPVRHTDVDLVAVLTELTRRRPAVHTTVPAGPVTVHASRRHLHRLLANLLDNAESHRGDRVDARLRADRETVVVHVDDDGSGIAPGDRDRIFDRFTRLDDARTRGRGGVGLGLAIARDIAHRHGGTLHVGDAPTGGARFTLRLNRTGRGTGDGAGENGAS